MSCVKSSQGFDWNQGALALSRPRLTCGVYGSRLLTRMARTELFLPSYADYESRDLERKQDPVQDIILTDEEVAAMFPQ